MGPSFNMFSGTAAKYGPDVPEEPFVDHLVRLGWLEQQGDSLGVTPLGRALLRNASIEDQSDESVQSVMLGANDALAYPTFIGHMAEAGDGLIIDPYTRVDQLLPVLQQTTIARLLVSENLSQGDRAALAVLVQSGVAARDFELRCAAKGTLHDRYIIGNSAAYTIGTSMGTIGGKHSTILTPLPEPIADDVRSRVEEWWDAATVLAVFPPVEPEEVDEADQA